jgi:hypothetical protein
MNLQQHFQKTQDHKEEARKLNHLVRVRLAPSPIHGVGVFALRNLDKGEQLFLDIVPERYTLPFKKFNLLDPVVRELILEQWPQVVEGMLFYFPTVRFQAFMNHAEDPHYEAHSDSLLKDVKAGEEITMNYRYIFGWDKVFSFLKRSG